MVTLQCVHRTYPRTSLACNSAKTVPIRLKFWIPQVQGLVRPLKESKKPISKLRFLTLQRSTSTLTRIHMSFSFLHKDYYYYLQDDKRSERAIIWHKTDRLLRHSLQRPETYNVALKHLQCANQQPSNLEGSWLRRTEEGKIYNIQLNSRLGC